MTELEQVSVNVADLRVLEAVCDELEAKNGMPMHPALTRLVAAILEPEWEPTDDYSPPSVADGTVTEALVTALRTLGDRYGPTGVANVAAELTEPEWEPDDDMRAKYRRANRQLRAESNVDDVLRALHREGLL